MTDQKITFTRDSIHGYLVWVGADVIGTVHRSDDGRWRACGVVGLAMAEMGRRRDAGEFLAALFENAGDKAAYIAHMEERLERNASGAVVDAFKSAWENTQDTAEEQRNATGSHERLGELLAANIVCDDHGLGSRPVEEMAIRELGIVGELKDWDPAPHRSAQLLQSIGGDAHNIPIGAEGDIIDVCPVLATGELAKVALSLLRAAQVAVFHLRQRHSDGGAVSARRADENINSAVCALHGRDEVR